MNKELKIGLVLIITIAGLFIGVNYLKGLNVLSKGSEFHARYENIGGLQVGASVLVNGYKVGMVSNITLLLEEDHDLVVTLSFDREFEIPFNTVAKIVNQDLMGTKEILLILGDANEYLELGDTLESSVEGSLQDEVNAQILPLKQKAEDLIGSVDSIMMIVTAVLNKDTRENLRNSLHSLDATFALMSKTMIKVDSLVLVNDERLSRIIFNFESITTNLEEGNGEVKQILANFSAISDSLAKANIASTLTNINAITSKINNGEGSLGLLMSDEKLYHNLEKSTKELAEVIEDIKMNPSRYVNFSIIGGSKGYKAPKKNK